MTHLDSFDSRIGKRSPILLRAKITMLIKNTMLIRGSHDALPMCWPPGVSFSMPRLHHRLSRRGERSEQELIPMLWLESPLDVCSSWLGETVDALTY